MSIKSVPISLMEFNFVGFYKSKSANENCDICRKSLLDSFPNSSALKKTDKIVFTHNISVGKCDHGFHKECMEKWKQSGKTLCPIDKTPWEEKKY